jgi:excinuclease UvrABC nuclease subunit
MDKNIISFEKGYYTEAEIDEIPEAPGIYCVYTGEVNMSRSVVSDLHLIYIGESKNVNRRLANHERKTDWESHLNNFEELCYSFAHMTCSEDERVRVEAAMIYHHKPIENDEYTDNFPYEDIEIEIRGAATADLEDCFIVKS